MIFSPVQIKLKIHSLRLARKNLEQSIPIIRSDNDIENIITRADQSIVGIVDLFIKADTGIHVMRAVEPNLRFGAAIRNHLNRTKYIPQCEYWNTSQVDKCTRIASRKQIGDALVKYQEMISVKMNEE